MREEEERGGREGEGGEGGERREEREEGGEGEGRGREKEMMILYTHAQKLSQYSLAVLNIFACYCKIIF